MGRLMASDDPKSYRPQFLDRRDEPWISALIDEYQRFEAEPNHLWKQRLREPLPFYYPHRKLRFVLKAFDELFPQEYLYHGKKIRELRQALFPLAETFSNFDTSGRREQILSNFVNPLFMDAIQRGESLDTLLFADLPSEKRLGRIPKEISMADIILAANTHLIRSIIQRSLRLDIKIRGQVRPIVRQALLRGLICVAKPLHAQTGFDAILSLSGPLGLFRHARVYGRLLGEVIPFLPQCDRFSLHAFVPEGEQIKIWKVESGDPIRATTIKKFDSQLEKKFSVEFSRAAPDFDLIREPQAVLVDGRFIFPDFAIKHRTNPECTWLLEIVGYWTEIYLQKKLESLNRANLDRLIICVSSRLGNSDEWPKNAQLVPFDRWINPADVLRAMNLL
jgi:predicted nuclease of restriction endonuclease-like RecB superfamily